ncbi:hypothetical protein OUZ56_028681 [Daphnia magna]|uniref:ERAP1-like C-terminal domain-containing protein n=1 Tax=Daphnia magna TaxID=35525 RepID=A0ABR0B4P6_9CRUS|nr:hypothetical protein OUZ56_028681 [Daphnia magna]
MAPNAVKYGLIRDQLIADHQRFADNRAQLLDDAFNLALIELLPYARLLILRCMKNENEYVPSQAVLSEFNYVDTMLYNFAEFPSWKLTPHFDNLSRIDAVNRRLGVTDCFQNSLTTYATLMTQPDNIAQIISPKEKSTVLHTAIENEGQVEYDFAFQQYKNTGDTGFLVAMCASKQATWGGSKRLLRLLEMLLDPNSSIRPSDVNTGFNNVENKPIGNEIALHFLINRWDDIQNAVKQNIEIVETNIKWVSLNQGKIGIWLAANQP